MGEVDFLRSRKNSIGKKKKKVKKKKKAKKN